MMSATDLGGEDNSTYAILAVGVLGALGREEPA